jgi:hypothetical protein
MTRPINRQRPGSGAQAHVTATTAGIPVAHRAGKGGSGASAEPKADAASAHGRTPLGHGRAGSGAARD